MPDPKPQRAARPAIVLVVAVAVLTLALAVFAGPAALPLPALVVGAAVAAVVLLVRRGRGRQALLVAAAAIPAAAAAFALGVLAAERVACGDDEERALRELPHLGGAQPGIAGDVERGGCVVRYGADEQPRAALRHYERAVRARGWRIVGVQTYEPDGSVGEAFAERGELALAVFWSRRPTETRLAIFVYG